MDPVVHPIEVESYRRMAARLDLSGFGPLAAHVVARVVHATAEPAHAARLVLTEDAVAAGVAALTGGAPVITDVQMLRAGLPGRLKSLCFLPVDEIDGADRTPGGLIHAVGPQEPGQDAGQSGCHGEPAKPDSGTIDPPATRSAEGIRRAARAHPHGAVWVVGCAPTALEELCRLYQAGEVWPALVVGTPVGFVGATEAKERLRASAMLSISNRGETGGSAMAAAVVNALARLVPPGDAPAASPLKPTVKRPRQ
ncbi:MAG: precorrin-8X methylmutase [Acidimicrobiales bacterium]